MLCHSSSDGGDHAKKEVVGSSTKNQLPLTPLLSLPPPGGPWEQWKRAGSILPRWGFVVDERTRCFLCHLSSGCAHKKRMKTKTTTIPPPPFEALVLLVNLQVSLLPVALDGPLRSWEKVKRGTPSLENLCMIQSLSVTGGLFSW
ncbi:hypothetical protein OPV22_031758 [Ensete ventricosum]|uniref:Uncharacterized protein n=1 Tax=Ensete ventricosum TaxID=4639 RepID=A0AAV8PUM2_ENSVE|nr:hypothetical protein OPV22_031758 [Ensete ventricosum]